MTTFVLICVAIIAVILTLWLVVIPAGVLAGTFTALRHGGWRGWRPH
jgi:hypothetical protein